MKSIIDAVTASVRPREQLIELPIFPLHSVLFPGGDMSLRVFETRYMDMAKSCLKNGVPFGVARIRDGAEVGAPAVPETIGTVARIADCDMQDLGILQLRVRGQCRFNLHAQTITRAGLIVGEVAMIDGDAHVDCAELPPCAAFLRKVLTQTGSAHLRAAQFDDAAWVGFRLSELLPFNEVVKQKMLELTDTRIRLEILHRFLHNQQLIA